MECTGYWYECECEDCKHVAKLYEDLEWFSDDPEFNKELLEEIKNEIESMGYCV